MSTITYHPTVYQAPITSDPKAMDITIQELPVKPQIGIIVTPLPYDEHLQMFLQKPCEKRSSPSTSTIEEKDLAESLSRETTLASVEDKHSSVVIPQAEEVVQKRVYLSRRERLSRWWQKERAEQKAFKNAMAPYYAF